jgi:hypothetical protein
LYGTRDYSVQNELDKGGDARWYAAMDATPSSVTTLIDMCKRLDAAMRADTLSQVREWYGNVDGDQVVDGWDDVAHKAATSDTSHLWHLHISFYRARADDDHTALLRVLTGDDDMSADDALRGAWLTDAIPNPYPDRLTNPNIQGATFIKNTVADLAAVKAALADLKAHPPTATVDQAAINAAVTTAVGAAFGELFAKVDAAQAALASAVKAASDTLNAP